MDTTDSSKQKQTSQISRTPTTRSAATPSKFGTRFNALLLLNLPLWSWEFILTFKFSI
jgi:hypothetical protein